MIGAEWIVVAGPQDRALADVRDMSELTFHHELSSAVLRLPGFRERWLEYWPKDRRQIHEYDQVANQAMNASPDPSTGFLSSYAMTNPENDFNVYCEKFFTNSRELEAIATMIPIVSEKLALLKSLYSELDPRLSERFREPTTRIQKPPD